MQDRSHLNSCCKPNKEQCSMDGPPVTDCSDNEISREQWSCKWAHDFQERQTAHLYAWRQC